MSCFFTSGCCLREWREARDPDSALVPLKYNLQRRLEMFEWRGMESLAKIGNVESEKRGGL